MQSNNDYTYRRGTTPNTRVVISQKNKIYAVSATQQTFSQVGLIASFSTSESRNVDEVRGLGYGDQIAELVPGITPMRSLSVTRTLLYLANVWQAFGYNAGVDGLVRSLKHHQWPFDVKHEQVFSRIATRENVPKQVVQSSDAVNEALLTLFEACWFTSWSIDFAADGGLVQESAEIAVTDIVDGVSVYGELAADAQSTGNSPFVGVGSLRFSNTGVGVPTPGL
jgi:hypothetical protein